MQRYIRGLMLAGTAVVAWGCADNPISDGAGDAAKVVASPSSIFVNTGATVATTVEVQNSQGAALASNFTLLNVDAGITAVIDSGFNPYYDADGNLVPPTSPTRVRVLVTGGGAAGVYSFDVAASGITEQVDVRVLPLDITGTFSNAAPACNAPVTYTVAAPYTFTSATEVFDESGIVPVNQSLAPDGLSVTFTPAPGYSGPITISGVELDFLPGAPVILESNETVTVGTDCGFTNQDDPFSAGPAVNSPALGTVFSFFDAGNIATFQYYVLNVTQAGNYSIELHWNNTSDVDLVVYDAGTLDALCTGFTLNNPEVCTLDLPVGQYYIESGLYAGAAPEIQWVTIDATGGN